MNTEMEKERLDDDYLNNKEQKLNCILKWLIESEPNEKMSMKKMMERMTDMMTKKQGIFKEQEQQEKQSIAENTWFDELNLITRFNENNNGYVPTVRPKLLKKMIN